MANKLLVASGNLNLTFVGHRPKPTIGLVKTTQPDPGWQQSEKTRLIYCINGKVDIIPS